MWIFTEFPFLALLIVLILTYTILTFFANEIREIVSLLIILWFMGVNGSILIAMAVIALFFGIFLKINTSL